MPEMLPGEDIALMMRVRVGDTYAFETLHGRYQRRVLGFFYGLSRDPGLSNDLCQETFLRIWMVRRRYRATGAFGAYVFAIARLVWLEHRRAEARRARLGPLAREGRAPMLSPENACGSGLNAEANEIEAHIFDALDALPEEQRLVFMLRHVRGLSLEDIAKSLDCPVNTVRSRKILAIKKLRHLLAPILASCAPGTPATGGRHDPL
jgi:RNA polymerase sigma-70 factor (ECF subfamily)